MNVPNKITICRIMLSILLLIIMIFPVDKVGINFPEFQIAGKLVIDSKYIICGIIFLIASLTDFLDGYLARKYNMVTDIGKVMDAIADKILVNGVLIIMACNGLLPTIIPVIIVLRDTFVDSIKMVASSKNGKAVGASKAGKIKTACMMLGLALMFFSNLPFELFGFSIGYYFVIIACVFSVYSGIQYFMVNKEALTKKL